jgi:hypothetical protein
MEREVGLDRLTNTERDVYLAATNLTQDAGDVVASDAIRNHDLVTAVAQATYHRSLRSLLSLGLLELAEGSKTKSYVVRPVSRIE